MRIVPGTAVAAVVMTVLVAACGSGGAATFTAVPAPTTAAGGGPSANASECPTPVPAGQTAPSGPRASGTITAITGTTFTLLQPDKTTVMVSTTPNTIYNKESPSSVGAIGVGDLLMVAPVATGGSVAATMIYDNGTQMMQRQRSALAAGCPFVPAGGNFSIGTVTKAAAPTLTLAIAGGKTMTVTTDNATKVTLREMSSFAELKAGDQVVMAVGPAPSGTASATTASGSASATSGFAALVVNFTHAAQ